MEHYCKCNCSGSPPSSHAYTRQSTPAITMKRMEKNSAIGTTMKPSAPILTQRQDLNSDATNINACRGGWRVHQVSVWCSASEQDLQTACLQGERERHASASSESRRHHQPQTPTDQQVVGVICLISDQSKHSLLEATFGVCWFAAF